MAQLDAFRLKYEEARRHMQQRERRVRREIERLEQDLLLLGLTGVEDKLQDVSCSDDLALFLLLFQLVLLLFGAWLLHGSSGL